MSGSTAYIGLDEPTGRRLLDEGARDMLAALVACLVPGDSHWPAAGRAVVDYLDASAAREPGVEADLQRMCREIAERAGDASDAERTDGEHGALETLLADLERREPILFESFRALVYEGYYRDRELDALVEERTGYAARVALEGLELPAFDTRLLDRVARIPGRFPDVGATDVLEDETWPPSTAPTSVRSGGRAQGSYRKARSRVADVLVIGAGAAGAAVCARLGSRGLDVLCLEQGEWYPPDDRPKAFPDWEVRDRRAWSPRVADRDSPCDYPVASVGDDPVDVLMVAAVGGSTVAYGGHFWRLSPSDFRLGTAEGFGVDWPISYSGPRSLLHAQRARHRGFGARGRPDRAPACSELAATATDRTGGRSIRAGFRATRLGLVGPGPGDRLPTPGGAGRLHESGVLPSGLSVRRALDRRHHVLAARA